MCLKYSTVYFPNCLMISLFCHMKLLGNRNLIQFFLVVVVVFVFVFCLFLCSFSIDLYWYLMQTFFSTGSCHTIIDWIRVKHVEGEGDTRFFWELRGLISSSAFKLPYMETAFLFISTPLQTDTCVKYKNQTLKCHDSVKLP